jgi:hypothetical protein
MKKVWMCDPNAGGAKISPQLRKAVEQRIKSYAEQKYAGKFLRLDVRFRGQFCYIDAFIEPYIHEPHNEELFGPKDEYIERMRNTPTHLVRLRFQGDMEAWSVAFFKYSDMKYEPCLFDDGEWAGTLEQAFDVGAVYLD